MADPFLPNFPVPPEIPPFDPVTLVFDIILSILRLFGIGAPNIAALASAVNNTWGNLLQTSTFLYNFAAGATNFLWKLLKTVVGGLSHIITDILHGHLANVLRDIQELLRALHNLFGPLLLWLRKLQAIQRQYQLQAMRRIINLIQRARQILVVFRLLHLKFATKLDNWLAGIEGKLISREYEIARKTNEIIAWVNLVAGVGGGLGTVPVVTSLGHMLAALDGALRAVGVERVYSSLHRAIGTPVPGRPWREWHADFISESAGKTGDYGEFHFAALEAYRRIREEVGT